MEEETGSIGEEVTKEDRFFVTLLQNLLIEIEGEACHGLLEPEAFDVGGEGRGLPGAEPEGLGDVGLESVLVSLLKSGKGEGVLGDGKERHE